MLQIYLCRAKETNELGLTLIIFFYLYYTLAAFFDIFSHKFALIKNTISMKY